MISDGFSLDDNRTAAGQNGRILQDRLSSSGSPHTYRNAKNESSMSSSVDIRKSMAWLSAIYWFVMTVVIVPMACSLTQILFLLPILLFSRPLYNWAEHELCRMVNDHWVACGQFTNLKGRLLIEYGDDVTPYAEKRCLCLANHLGLIDHFCLMSAFHDKLPVTKKYLWVIFNIWKYTPLGIMWSAHGNFFINGGAHRRQRVLDEFRQHLRENYWRGDYGWVVMYPEGSRLFLIRDSEQEYCKKVGLTPFRHCAHPRSSAAFSVLSECCELDPEAKRAPVEYVIDCTLGYQKGVVPGLGEAMIHEWPNDVTTVAIHYKVHKIKREWAQDEAKLKEWLYEQYKVKDDLLEEYYKTGTFPGKGRRIEFSLVHGVMVEVFWCALFYFHYNFTLKLVMKPVAMWILRLFWNFIF